MAGKNSMTMAGLQSSNAKLSKTFVGFKDMHFYFYFFLRRKKIQVRFFIFPKKL